MNGRIAMDESNELKRRVKEDAENVKQNNKKRLLNSRAVFDDSSDSDSSELVSRAPEDGKNVQSVKEEVNEKRQEEIDNLPQDSSKEVKNEPRASTSKEEHTEESHSEGAIRADDLSNCNTTVKEKIV